MRRAAAPMRVSRLDLCGVLATVRRVGTRMSICGSGQYQTNGLSKKAENQAAAVALHYMYVNFARPHKSLANPCPRTPAMAAGLDHIWTCEEIAGLLD